MQKIGGKGLCWQGEREMRSKKRERTVGKERGIMKTKIQGRERKER